MIAQPHSWIIERRLSNKEIDEKLKELNDMYAGRLVVLNKNGDNYRITHFSILNHSGMAEYAVNYHPYCKVNERDYPTNKHTRSAREFFDGRYSFKTETMLNDKEMR